MNLYIYKTIFDKMFKTYHLHSSYGYKTNNDETQQSVFALLIFWTYLRTLCDLITIFKINLALVHMGH